MGLGKLLSFVRKNRNNANVSDVKVDPGGGSNITAEHFSPPGDDSNPLPGDFVFTVAVSGTGRESVAGYVDPKNDSKSGAGEKRIYARDGSGASVVEIWLKSTGEATIINQNGSVTLNPDGGTTTTTPNATFSASADGSITGSNDAGSFKLTVPGDFVVNGAIIDTSGNIISPGTVAGDIIAGTTSLSIAGKELKDHTHPAGTPPGDTGANN